jgi:hypothetical protein
MKPLPRVAITMALLAASSCIGSSPGTEADIGTESGNPRILGTCLCETDEDCQGIFDEQIEQYDASVRTVQCSVDTGGCRAVLEVEGQCYVNLAVESRAYDCGLSDEEIFEQSESDPDRPFDQILDAEQCE